MNLQFFSEYFHREAEKVRLLDEVASEDLHMIASYLAHRIMPCAECGGIMSVFEKICPASEDFRAGFKFVMKCPDCGEMEVK